MSESRSNMKFTFKKNKWQLQGSTVSERQCVVYRSSFCCREERASRFKKEKEEREVEMEKAKKAKLMEQQKQAAEAEAKKR